MLRTLQQFLSKFITLSPEDFNKLAQLVEVKQLDKKVQLTRIGEVEQNLNFILKGLMRKYFLKGREEVITHITKEGNILTSSASFFSRLPSRYIVETIEPSVIVTLSYDHLHQLIISDKNWERAARVVITNFFLEQEYWMLDSIRLSTRERFRRFVRQNPDLLQRVPQKQLASFLNIKPETFSRMKHSVGMDIIKSPISTEII